MPRTPDIKTNTRKCSIDIRVYDPPAYRLPTDGRKWKRLCVNRQRLANFLASWANPDGTCIEVGWARMATFLGLGRATVFSLLDDLSRVGPGLLTTNGKVSEHGTAVRTLNVDVLEAEVQDREPKSGIGVSQSLVLEKPKSEIGERRSGIGDPKSEIGERRSGIGDPKSTRTVDPTVTEVLPPPPPYRTKAGEEAANLPEPTTDIAVELSKVRDFWRTKQGTELPESLRDTTELKKLIEEHGRKVFSAFRSFYGDGDWAGMKQPLLKFVAQFDKWVAGAAHDREAEVTAQREQEEQAVREKLSEIGAQVCHALVQLTGGYNPANFLSSLPEEQRSRVTTLDATDYWERALEENVEFLWTIVKLQDVFDKNERDKETKLTDALFSDLGDESK